MNLLQIAQKMFEKSISESYLADCCGVSKVYMHQALKGSIPMNPTLEKKIENIIGVIDLSNGIQAKKEETKKSAKLQELKKRLNELNCTYKEISKHSERGYGANYIYEVLTGRKPASKRMYDDLMKAFDSIEEERTRPENDETKLVDYGVTLLKDFDVTKKEPEPNVEEQPKVVNDNPFKDMLVDVARAYGKSNHSMEFDAEGYHLIFQLGISNLED